MRVRIKYFGILRDIAGKKEEILDTEAQTVGELLKVLEGRLEGFSQHRKVIKIACGHQLISESEPLKEGMELALLPPVSGGW